MPKLILGNFLNRGNRNFAQPYSYSSYFNIFVCISITPISIKFDLTDFISFIVHFRVNENRFIRIVMYPLALQIFHFRSHPLYSSMTLSFFSE